jgi:hypothetical protein
MKTLKTYLAAVLTSSTSAIGVYFDVVETLTEQLTSVSTAYTDVAGHVDTVSGNTRNAYAYQTAAVPDALPQVRETESYRVRLHTNSLYANKAVATNEGLTIGYGGVNSTIKGTAAITTVAALITAINADTTLGSGIDVTAAQDVNHRSVQTISYTDSTGASETPAAAGTLGWQFGTSTGTINAAGGGDLGTSSTTIELATALALQLTGTVVSGVGYGATASGSALVFIRNITNTSIEDEGKSSHTFPSLSFRLDNLTDTTVDLAAGANTNAAGLNSDFFLSVANSDLKDLRITIKNNSTSVALAATLTGTGTDTAIVLTSGLTNIADLVSGTNMTGDASVQSVFADIYSPGSGVAAVTTNRTGW